MKTPKLLFFIISLVFANKSMSQNIASHQWEHRVLLILTDNKDDVTIQNQIKELQTQKSGLAGRKLIIYQVKKQQYKNGLKPGDWKKSTKLYKTYKSNNAAFEVILIGLDGGIKLRQNHLLSCEELFKTIDVMPMRKAELKRKRDAFKN